MATPSATVKNEAAERLLDEAFRAALSLGYAHSRDEGQPFADKAWQKGLEALAAERHATVERIRALTDEAVEKWGIEALPTALLRIFAEEAAR